MTTPTDEPITIKKYANRRLYNTATSSYVTLDHLAEMVKRGQEFNVHDAKTGDDITRAVLTQIIFEEEGKGGQQLLPIQFLRQLIRFYGDSMQALVPGYLNLSMESFSKNHERIRDQLATAFGGKNMLKDFEGIARQNMVAFLNTDMFSLGNQVFLFFAYFRGDDNLALAFGIFAVGNHTADFADHSKIFGFAAN